MFTSANVTLFPEESNYEKDFLITKLDAFAKEKLMDLPAIIKMAYRNAKADLSGRVPAGVRRNSRPLRVDEGIAILCSQIFPENFREVASGKYVLYFPDICQIHMVKTYRKRMPPRKSRTAKAQLWQASLPFPECPILHLCHEEFYDGVSVSLKYFCNGQCSWVFPLSEWALPKNHKPIDKLTVEVREDEVFATPKRKRKKELETA